MTRETTLTARIVETPEITSIQRSRMFSILEKYFEGYQWDNFHHDLNEKNGVLLLETDTIQGFTTFQFLKGTVAGKAIRAVFSGDTILEKEYWGETVLGTEWSKYMLKQAATGPASLYWFLLCSGYKTYRFLPAYFNEFYPRYNEPTPQYEQEVLDYFATVKFRDMYTPETGIVRFKHSDERLKPGVADITDAKRNNPHIQFFIEKNPRHAEGEELCCITEISPANYRQSALRRFNHDTNKNSVWETPQRV